MELRNTRQMSLAPEPGDAFVELDKDSHDSPIKFRPVLSADAFRECVPYSVIVEGWDKRKTGWVKRAWEKEFTAAERRKVSRYYATFYRWYFVTGTPRQVMVTARTLTLLIRACRFFATI